MKKLICIILSITFVISAFAVSSFAEDEGKRKNFLVLGDSIAEGYGVKNSYEASYGRIVADTDNYSYENYARVANDTKDLIYKIENSPYVRGAIKRADIINICIGSNNYLANDDVVMITVGAIFGFNNKQLDEIADDMYNDYVYIYDTIREMNPDAVIIWNRIYCAWKGLGHIPFSKAVKRINSKVDLLKETYPDIVLFDTDKVITHNTDLIADDCVHPNAAGNVALAREMLLLLKEQNLGTATEPVINYQGEDYNFYVENFGDVFGKIIYFIVKLLTLNF